MSTYWIRKYASNYSCSLGNHKLFHELHFRGFLRTMKAFSGLIPAVRGEIEPVWVSHPAAAWRWKIGGKPSYVPAGVHSPLSRRWWLKVVWFNALSGSQHFFYLPQTVIWVVSENKLGVGIIRQLRIWRAEMIVDASTITNQILSTKPVRTKTNKTLFSVLQHKKHFTVKQGFGNWIKPLIL